MRQAIACNRCLRGRLDLYGSPAPSFSLGNHNYVPFRQTNPKSPGSLAADPGLAEKNDSQVMFPLHLLIALAEEKEGIVRPVLEKCGVQPDAIVVRGPPPARRPCPKPAACSPACTSPRRSTRSSSAPSTKPSASRTNSSPPSTCCSPSPNSAAIRPANCSNRAGATHDAILKALVSVRGTQRVTDQNPESKYQALGALRPRPHRIRPAGQARPRHRPRRRDPPRHAGAQPPHQEQSRADRRTRRRQDRHRRRPGPAHRPRRRARSAQEQEAGRHRPRLA